MAELSYWEKKFTIIPSDAPTSWKNRAKYVADGTADEEEINDLIDAVYANGGGPARLAPGTFTVASSILPKGYVQIDGPGALIEAAAAFTDGLGVIHVDDTAAGVKDYEHGAVRNLRINCNRYQNTVTKGLYVNISATTNFWHGNPEANWTFENIHISRPTREGVHVDNTANNTRGIHMDRVRVAFPGFIGFNIESSDSHYNMLAVGTGGSFNSFSESGNVITIPSGQGWNLPTNELIGSKFGTTLTTQRAYLVGLTGDGTSSQAVIVRPVTANTSNTITYDGTGDAYDGALCTHLRLMTNHGIIVQEAANLLTNCRTWNVNGDGLVLRGARNSVVGFQSLDPIGDGLWVAGNQNTVYGLHSDNANHRDVGDTGIAAADRGPQNISGVWLNAGNVTVQGSVYDRDTDGHTHYGLRHSNQNGLKIDLECNTSIGARISGAYTGLYSDIVIRDSAGVTRYST